MHAKGVRSSTGIRLEDVTTVFVGVQTYVGGQSEITGTINYFTRVTEFGIRGQLTEDGLGTNLKDEHCATLSGF